MNNSNSQQMRSSEPKIAWAIKARRHLALGKDELLYEAIAEAHGQIEIVSFLEAYADGNLSEVDRLNVELIPKLQQSNRSEEVLTVSLFHYHTRASLVEEFIQFPFEEQKQARELGIQACQQAIHIVQALGDKLCQAVYSGILGSVFWKSSQLREAEHFCTESYQLFLELTKQEPHIFNQYVAITLNNLGNVQSDLRKLLWAEKSYAKALQINRELAKAKPQIFKQEIATTLNGLGNAQYAMRKFVEAEESLTEALQIREELAANEPQIYKQYVAKTLNNLGNLQGAMRKFEVAENYLTKALHISQELAEEEPQTFKQDLATVLTSLGIVQRKMRNWLNSGESLTKALQIREKLAANEPQIFNQYVAMSLNNLGNLQSETQVLAEAENSLTKALFISRELAEQEPSIFNRVMAGTLNNLSAVKRDLGKFEEAEEYLTEALQIREKLAEQEPYIYTQDVAMTLNNLGTVQWFSGNHEEAVKSYAKALKLYKNLMEDEPQIFNQDEAMTLNNLGYLLFEQDKFEDAKKSFESARKLIEDVRTEAITIDDRNRIMQENVNVYNGLLGCYLRMREWKKALEVAELGKSRSLSDLLNLKSEDLQPKAPTSDTLAIVRDLGKKYSDFIKELQRIESYERYLSKELSRYENDIKRIKNDNEDNDQTRQINLRQIEEEKNNLEQEKRKVQDQKFAGQTELKRVLHEVRTYDNEFPPKAKLINADGIFEISKNQNRIIVMFRILRKSIVAIFVFPTGELHIEEVKDFGQNEMFELFSDNWFVPYQNWKSRKVGFNEWKEAIEQTLDTVYEKLLVYVHLVLKEKAITKEVLFVPNQSLALLPLHAASWKDETGKRHYLIEEYTISYAPSVSVFKRCQDNDKQRSNKTLFVTNPTGDLISSEKEVEFIENLHQDNNNLLKENATKSAVVEALKENYSFTHFSCHGFYNQANPFESGLVMFKKQVIKLSEIINSSLQRNWLTTLSACETGMVDFASPTDEHFGLPLGFIFAGSPSVWASLWSVNDKATSELMKIAYENLSKEEYKNNKPEALRQAQLSIIKHLPHPFFWAGFQHFGV